MKRDIRFNHAVKSSRAVKVSFLFIVLLAAALTVAAQQPPAPVDPADYPTRLEAFEAVTGMVVVKNYTVIGSIAGFGGTVAVTSYEFVDGQSGRKEYGLGVEVAEGGQSARTASAYIDYDEIDAFVRALDQIIKIDKSATMENFEAQYTTRGEVSAATFIRPNGALRAAVSIGTYRKATVIMSLGKLADFRKMIVDGKAAIDKIR